LLQDQSQPRASHQESSTFYSPAKPGNLRLFFGGSAGLTAVRIMLEAGTAARQTGVDVVVGSVSATGNSAIDDLLRDFESLSAVHASTAREHLHRMDVDAVRKRAPAILLVDTQIQKSGRHAKSTRNYASWDDIESVLEFGVNVWAALDATGFSSWTSVGVGTSARRSGSALL
jgi:K+-sensing histidine kinase KdpD